MKMHILITVFSPGSGTLSKAKSGAIKDLIRSAIANPDVFVSDVARGAHSTSATLRLESADLPLSAVMDTAIAAIVDALWQTADDRPSGISVAHSFFEK